MNIYVLSYHYYDSDDFSDREDEILCVSYSRETCVEYALKYNQNNFIYSPEMLQEFKEGTKNYLQCGYEDFENDDCYEEFIISTPKIQI